MAAIIIQLPCDGEGICMVCKNTPLEEEKLACGTCVTPWHVSCLVTLPENLQSTLRWECPDCTAPITCADAAAPSGVSSDSNGLIAAIQAIEANSTLSEVEKARRRQQLLSGNADSSSDGEGEKGKGLCSNFLEENIICSCCLSVLDRPVSIPCGHNCCLICFKKWTAQGKNTCAKCRKIIPSIMIKQPRINSGLVDIIRSAKLEQSNGSTKPKIVPQFVHNQDRPDTAFRSDRAKRAGNGNASSGRILVTVAPDHFGPILAENDPKYKRGVLVGDGWGSRLECRQWGVHLPHIAGISGQAKYGAQSVVLSGGYEDDEDHGEWFLYTGSGGRDLSGNKRTNKDQSSDQQFEKYNEALRLSCKKGYPVRVVRSHKEKRSSYAPEMGIKGLRYDGIYRVEKCWRKEGRQGFKVCRYLFVRCDNAPAPWTSDEQGDVPRVLPVVCELNKATNLFERKEKPMWDYDNEDGCWKWTKPPPASQKLSISDEGRKGKRTRTGEGVQANKKLLKGLSCLICKKMMVLPVTTPCAHNFCKGCLESTFSGQTFIRERTSARGRSLRTQKNIMKCPSCANDIAEFLQNPQVNRDLQMIIEAFQQKDDVNDEAVEEVEVEVEEENEIGSEEDATDESVGNDAEVEEDNSESPPFKRAKVEKAVVDEKTKPNEETAQPKLAEKRKVSGRVY